MRPFELAKLAGVLPGTIKCACQSGLIKGHKIPWSYNGRPCQRWEVSPADGAKYIEYRRAKIAKNLENSAKNVYNQTEDARLYKALTHLLDLAKKDK